MEHKGLQITGSSRILVFKPKGNDTLKVISGRLINYGYKLTEENEFDIHCNSIYLNIGDKSSNIIKPKSFIYTQHDRLDDYYVRISTEDIEEGLMIARKASYKTEEDIWKEEPIFKDNKVLGVKESQSQEKPPIFTFCNQMRLAIKELSLRSLYGHKKYFRNDQDWKNFSRVENADYEYSNAEFRHALGFGEDSERDHLIATAWNAIARLQIYLEKE